MTRGVDTADLVYMCRTVAPDERWLDTDDNSDTDSVCYDFVCLMPLIRITMHLSSDGDGTTVNRTGYNRDYDGSPAGLLGVFHGYVSDTHRIAKTGKLHIRDRILKTTH